MGSHLIELDGSKLALLQEILRLRAPEYLDLIGRGGRFKASTEQLNELRELVGDELCASGLDSHDAPTARGLALEDLIDALSPYH